MYPNKKKSFSFFNQYCKNTGYRLPFEKISFEELVQFSGSPHFSHLCQLN